MSYSTIDALTSVNSATIFAMAGQEYGHVEYAALYRDKIDQIIDFSTMSSSAYAFISMIKQLGYSKSFVSMPIAFRFLSAAMLYSSNHVFHHFHVKGEEIYADVSSANKLGTTDTQIELLKKLDNEVDDAYKKTLDFKWNALKRRHPYYTTRIMMLGLFAANQSSQSGEKKEVLVKPLSAFPFKP